MITQNSIYLDSFVRYDRGKHFIIVVY